MNRLVEELEPIFSFRVPRWLIVSSVEFGELSVGENLKVNRLLEEVRRIECMPIID